MYFKNYLKLELSTPNRLYIDMDGVLTNFDKAFENIDGRKQKDFKNNHELWKHVEKNGVKFWSEMPWMEDGKKFWNFISKYNPTILSSPTLDYKSRIGKRIWVKRELGDDIKVILETQKERYANRNSILVDDREDNINKWKRFGGIGILHKSANDSIEKLKEIR